MRTVEQRNWFYSQGKIAREKRDDAPYEFYQMKTTGQVVCEHTLDLGLGTEPVEIALLADLHFNYCLPEDDIDEETSYTKTRRVWGRGAAFVDKARAALDGASYSDQIIVLGDIIDYLTKGAMMLTKKYVVDAYPDVMMCVAHHDMTKQMQTGRPNLLTNEERLDILRTIWPHDIDFYVRDLNDKLTVICLGIALVRYTSDFTEKLEAEIKRAREEGRKILLFQHEPFSTGKPEDAEVQESYVNPNGKMNTFNCYDDRMRMCRPADPDEVNWKVYKLITSSADVVKGIFVGHEHIQVYTEIPAVDNEGNATVIPQHVVAYTPGFSQGYYMRVIVK